eukprot:TRINITY_DN12431_c0_g1_i3.p1 TRINITY_DN12431_c0_g1~~TRINITY_DN12431_c0_g1_i3.p1  ORF type:complete len:918 (-),score=128.00 TRINITY_DN12431_c0_g1_i3:73-2424(-)
MVVAFHTGHFGCFIIVSLFLLVNAVANSLIAFQRFDESRLRQDSAGTLADGSGHPSGTRARSIVRSVWIVVAYGFFQAIQLQRMYDQYYDQKVARGVDQGDYRPTADMFYVKAFESLFMHVPFALTNSWLWIHLQLDCASYFDLHNTSSNRMFSPFCLIACFFSICSIALAAIEVDSRVSKEVKKRLGGSSWFILQLGVFRLSEVCGRVMLVAIELSLCFEGLPSFGRFHILTCALVVVHWGMYSFLLWSATPRGSPESIMTSVFVALPSFLVISTYFVDMPHHIKEAREVTHRLLVLRFLELTVLLAIIACVHNCSVMVRHDCRNFPAKSVDTYSHFILPPAMLELTLACHVLHVVLLFTGMPESARPCGQGRLVGDAVLELIPETDGTAQVTEPRGVSSLLLTIGTGLTHDLFVQPRPCLARDFVLERIVGRGTFGTVVKVRRVEGAHANELIPSFRHRRNELLALKMMRTCSDDGSSNDDGVIPESSVLAEREWSILRVLSHPFIVRMLYYFEVPDREWREEFTGATVSDRNGYTRFHRAILMEYCPEGDLSNHVLSRSVLETGANSQLDVDASGDLLSQFLHFRRLCAELAVVLRFLHNMRPVPVVFRDLKPDNVLIKRGRRGSGDRKLHVCLTDFGFAKQPTLDDPLTSCAGSPWFSAPEVPRPDEHRSLYTPAVDLFSFGKTMLVMLWRRHWFIESRHKSPEKVLHLPHPRDFRWKSDSRFPSLAVSLINKLTSGQASRRGTIDAVMKDPFFVGLDFEHLGSMIKPIDMDNLDTMAS